MSKSDGNSDDAPHAENAVLDRKQAAVQFLQLVVAGRIVEMWDCGQPVPTDSPNKDGAF